MKGFCLILIVQIFSKSFCLTLEEIKPNFDKHGCIQGTLVLMDSGKLVLKAAATSHIHLETEDDIIMKISTNALTPKEYKEKNFLSLIHELAVYNKIDYYYHLIDEEGLPHDKTFSMDLMLGNEKYSSKGRSIKKAKDSVAQIALMTTKYAIPPSQPKKNVALLTPTVQLNNLASKLGLKVTYVMHNDVVAEEEDVHQSSQNYYNNGPEILSGKSYVRRLNHSIYHPFKMRYTKLANENTNEQLFNVFVHVGANAYAGSGYTVQAARHDAASKAIKALSKMSHKEVENCLNKGEECNPNNIKSPISLVYETAQKRNLPVEFEIIAENGPAHEKEFVTRCQVGDLVTEGEGKSKKASKKKSAEKMLKRLQKIEPIVGDVVLENFKSDLVNKRKKKQKKNKNVIKSKFGKLARDAQGLLAAAYEYFVPDETSVPKPSVTKTARNNHESNKLDDDVLDKYNPKDVLLDLTQQKGITLNYLNLFEAAHKYYSMLSLGIHPQHICLGESTSFSLAQEKAALEALNFLYKFGLDILVANREMFNDGTSFQHVEVWDDVQLDKESN